MADAESALADVLPRGALPASSAVPGRILLLAVLVFATFQGFQFAACTCSSSSYLGPAEAWCRLPPGLLSSAHQALNSHCQRESRQPPNTAKKGTEVLPYKGPAPAEGRHRYIFLLYKQAERVDIDSPKERDHSDFSAFATQHNLGPLLAAPYFYAEPQESQPRV
eukprot:SM000158S02019  [mRNA]  locus=s158:96359:97107:+ [translate_table: standard]